jgi:hypothetical protein
MQQMCSAAMDRWRLLCQGWQQQRLCSCHKALYSSSSSGGMQRICLMRGVMLTMMMLDRLASPEYGSGSYSTVVQQVQGRQQQQQAHVGVAGMPVC